HQSHPDHLGHRHACRGALGRRARRPEGLPAKGTAMSTRTVPVTKGASPQTAEHVTVKYSADSHTATILIDRSSKLNALTLGLLEDLASATREIAASKARLVIVRTAGEKVFCV